MKYRTPTVYSFQYFASSLDQGGQADFLRKQRSSTFSQFEFCLIAWDGQRWVLGEAGSKLWDCRLLRRKRFLEKIIFVISNRLQVIWVLMVHIHIVWWSIEGKSLSVRSIWWAMWNHCNDMVPSSKVKCWSDLKNMRQERIQHDAVFMQPCSAVDMQEMERMQSRCRESLRCVLGSRCREVGGEEEGFLDLAERLTRGPKACTFRKVSRVKRPVKRALR